jgi:hypothetical protein
MKASDIKTEVYDSVVFSNKKGKPEKFYKLILPTGREFQLISKGKEFELSITALTKEERKGTNFLDYETNSITYFKEKIADFINQNIISIYPKQYI